MDIDIDIDIHDNDSNSVQRMTYFWMIRLFLRYLSYHPERTRSAPCTSKSLISAGKKGRSRLSNR